MQSTVQNINNKKSKMKDHLIFIGKVAVGVVVGVIVYEFIKKSMATKRIEPVMPVTVTETATI